jgi:tetratricopeptide (TPR) repeat protein
MEKVWKISDCATEALNKDEYDEAISLWTKALKLLPPPSTQWKEAVFFISGIGDAYIGKEEWKNAKPWFEQAINFNVDVDVGVDTAIPYYHLRLGIIHFELGDMKLAQKHVEVAFTSCGEEIFHGENPKYFNLLSSFSNCT